MDAEDLLAALRVRPATAEQLALRIGGVSTQSVARTLSWMQRNGYPVVRAPLYVARAYARMDGRPSPRASEWRVR